MSNAGIIDARFNAEGDMANIHVKHKLLATVQTAAALEMEVQRAQPNNSE